MQLTSQQETCKIVSCVQTLHEWMCFESENTVRHNWTDVAIHDRRIIDEMQPGDTRLWVIWELGSLFLPMYCKLSEESQLKEDYKLTSVEIYMLRFFKEDQFATAQTRVLMDAKVNCKYYFIIKGTNDYNSLICPTTFHSVVDLVFCGKANLFT